MNPESPLSLALRERLHAETVYVRSAAKLAEALHEGGIAFVDDSTLPLLVGERPPGPVIALCDDTLPKAVGWLPEHPWLSHVIGGTMLTHPMGAEHLENTMKSLERTDKPKLIEWLTPNVTGRRVRLAHAGRRAERLDRMGEFLEQKGIGSRTIQLLRDAGEELLTNAFYDAPVAAGALERPISRTQDVLLPDDCACDMVYGSHKDLAIVRVRDPFGSFTRERLVQVLTRCAQADMQVEVDESMGGAGLGLWRIFTAASFVAISVVANRHTEFLVGIGKRIPGPKPFAFHLYFRQGKKPRFWRLLEDSMPTPSKSITIVNA